LPVGKSHPSAIIAHTVKGKGVSFAENTYLWHSNSVDDDVHAKAISELGET
jgi:transketolase